MGGQKSKANVSPSSNADVTQNAAASQAVHPKRRIVQNCLLMWVDTSVDQSTEDCQNTLAQLRSVVNDVTIFIESDQCIQSLNDVEDEKVFVIASGFLGQHLIPDIHAMPQVDAIYIFCGNKSRHEQWVKGWPKIKGIHTEITPICKALQLAVKKRNQDTIAMSFVTMDEATSSQNLNQLEPSFMYTQIFKEILLDLEYDRQSIKDFTIYCRNSDYGSSTIITQFENEYDNKSAIWWYTFPSFIYSMLNCALRMLEADIIIKMGFFIHDLHHQIKQIYQNQIDDYQQQAFVVYRGQGLSKKDFEKLLKTKGGLMSFNNFLSTSKNEEVSLDFAKNALTNTDTVGILFKMSIDPSVSSAPFASIRETSYFQEEEEILFSMHTVFRVGEITKIDDNSLLYQVELKLTDDDDQQLRTITKYIREETAGETSWNRLSVLLVKIGRFDTAEELFSVLLEQTSDANEKACYYNNLGYIKDMQRDYEQAIGYYKKALEINESILPADHPNSAVSYNNIGSVYHNMGQYAEALSFYKKALEIREKTLSPDHSVLATSYNNIGGVYNSMREFSNALSFYKTACEILQKTLPLNHPLMATFYNNIGSAYDNMEEYTKALPFYETALEIREKTLPPNHPVVVDSYNNTGRLYERMKEYEKALLFYEKALEIRQKALPPDHPDLADSCNYISSAYNNIGEYSKALSFTEKALQVRETVLPPNHPSLASSYNNIGFVYNSMGEYSKALSYFERALGMEQHSLPPNHPTLIELRENIEDLKKKF